MLRLRYVALLAAVGCSPVKDTSNVPDAPIDSTDTRAPEIESSNPANMGTKVSVLQPISVFFDEQLDPATVSATTVKVGYNQNVPQPLFPFVDILKSHGPGPAGMTQVKGTVEYDAGARKVSFVPAAPLPYGTQFLMTFDVKDKGGVAFTGTLTFTTFQNAITKQYFFNTNGVPYQSYVSMIDMTTGRITKRWNAYAPGTDQIWFSADDTKNGHYEFAWGMEGRPQDERAFSPGPDGLYDTADDVQNTCVHYTYDAMRNPTERTYSTTAGTDGMWCTADDVPNNNSVYAYTGNTMTGWIYFVNPGTDGMWRTADDKCNYFWEYTYDAQNRKTREVLRYCGADQFPRTADDQIQYYYDYEYDTAGNVSSSTYRTSMGPDGMWLTMDDNYGFYDHYTYDANGLATQFMRSYGPGTDMMWGTGDDPGQLTVMTYNAKKLPEELTMYNGSGADTMWGTPDDVIMQYMKTTYDGLGNRVDQKTYAAGADGTWKNADDRVTVDSDFDTGR